MEAYRQVIIVRSSVHVFFTFQRKMYRGFDVEQVRDLAHFCGYEELDVKPHEYKYKMTFAKINVSGCGGSQNHYGPVIVDVFFRKRTVLTLLDHPKKGRRRMSRKCPNMEMLRKIFVNPRYHSNVGSPRNVACPLCGVRKFHSSTSVVQHVEAGACPSCPGKSNARRQIYRFVTSHHTSHFVLSNPPVQMEYHNPNLACQPLQLDYQTPQLAYQPQQPEYKAPNFAYQSLQLEHRAPQLVYQPPHPEYQYQQAQPQQVVSQPQQIVSQYPQLVSQSTQLVSYQPPQIVLKPNQCVSQQSPPLEQHYNDQLYECKVCYRQFFNLSSLMQHRRDKHENASAFNEKMTILKRLLTMD